MANPREYLPQHLAQVARATSNSVGELAQCIADAQSNTIIDTLALGVASALEKQAARIREMVTRAQLYDDLNQPAAQEDTPNDC